MAAVATGARLEPQQQPRQQPAGDALGKKNVKEPVWQPLLRPSVEVAIRRLVGQLLRCGSVRSCLLIWHFIADYVVHPAFYRPTPSGQLYGISVQDIQAAATGLYLQATGRAAHHASVAAYTTRNVQVVRNGLHTEQKEADNLVGRPPAHRSALLVHFKGMFPSDSERAQPFIDLLRCFAKRQGMAFVHDTDPHMQFAWVGRVPAGAERADAYTVVVPPGTSVKPAARQKDLQLAMNISGVAAVLDDVRTSSLDILRFISRLQVWRHLERNLAIINGNPIRWAKVPSILRALDRHDAVVFMDYDVTVRPDCLGAVRLLDTLFAPSYTGAKPSIVLRDSPLGVDCLNTGFVAFRSTVVAKAFLRQWEAKMHWAGVIHGDQGAFAETLLEFINIEYRMAGLTHAGAGYRGNCLEFLVPNDKGLRSWRSYCDCFQMVLERLVGAFRWRTAVHVRFVDPRSVDVNFVPNSLTPDHGHQLSGMRLLDSRPPITKTEAAKDAPTGGAPSGERPARISPLLVHWAGIPNRTKLMRDYLVRRFGVRPMWFQPGQDAADRCSALFRLSPRTNPQCAAGIGKLGTDIEDVW